MSPLHPPDRDGHLEDFRPILLANLLPLAGVLWLGWEPATLVLIYGLEILLSLLIAGGKALFAQRPPPSDRDGIVTVSEADLTAKRGSFRPIDRLPPIYPRNVPFALGVVFLLAMATAFLVVVGLVLTEGDGVGLEPAVLASVLALVAGQLLETKRQYFGRRAYADVSPYGVIETPARQLFVLLFLVAYLALAFGSVGTLVVIVGLKLLVEWSTFRAARGDAAAANRFVDRFVSWFAGPEKDEGRDDPVRAPTTEPSARVRVTRRAVALESLLLACWATVAYLPFVAIFWFFGVLLVVVWLDSVLVFWLGVAGFLALVPVIAAVQFAKQYLLSGHLEYQRRGPYLVAYDRLVEAPQWAAPLEELRDVTVVPDRFADRLLGTRTIEVTTGIRSTETERRLGPVAEADRLVDAFDLPLASTDLEPVSRPLAAGAVALSIAILVAPAVFFAVPGVPEDVRLGSLFAAPFALLVPVRLWKRACSGGE